MLSCVRGWFGLQAPRKIERMWIWHLRKCQTDFPKTTDSVCLKPLVRGLIGDSFFIYLTIETCNCGATGAPQQRCWSSWKASARRLRQPLADPPSCEERGHPKPASSFNIYLLKSILCSRSHVIHSSTASAHCPASLSSRLLQEKVRRWSLLLLLLKEIKVTLKQQPQPSQQGGNQQKPQTDLTTATQVGSNWVHLLKYWTEGIYSGPNTWANDGFIPTDF